MKNKRSLVIALFLSVILALSVMSAFASALPNDTVVAKVFTTYIGDTLEIPEGTPGTESYNEYIYSGVSWPAGSKVTYSVNTKGAPAGALAAVKTAFETWDSAVKVELFNDDVKTANSKASGNKFDGANVISWGRLKPGIIAQTTTWYNPNTNQIVEIGIVFNTMYRWSTGSVSNAFDVENIATHEAGHTLMLLDLYDDAASQLTMYGYGAPGETYARTLGAGDISGIQYIYGPAA
jgi:hypothetical protein